MRKIYRCALCNQPLKQERWVYSQKTGLRYHWYGECKTKRKVKK